MNHPRILIQFDCDDHASVFDAVVGVDSGIEHLLQYSGVTAENVTSLVHGAMFTRAPADLKQTAIFVGGSDSQRVDAVAQQIVKAFFGPVKVSVLLDGNGSNTTAAAAVLCAARHAQLQHMRALVLGGTGPVGGRVARILARQQADVLLASRDLGRAQSACDAINTKLGDFSARLEPIDCTDDSALNNALCNATAIFSCGAAGASLLSESQLQAATKVAVAIDLNAVPPAGLPGITATDKAVQRGSRTDYGAIGVGGLKMKIHRAAIRSLFSSNDLFLDAEEVFDIGMQIEAEQKLKIKSSFELTGRTTGYFETTAVLAVALSTSLPG